MEINYIIKELLNLLCFNLVDWEKDNVRNLKLKSMERLSLNSRIRVLIGLKKIIRKLHVPKMDRLCFRLKFKEIVPY